MMFLMCPNCRKSVTDRNALMLSQHFPWICPHCDAENPPVGTPHEIAMAALDDDAEDALTIEKGWACERDGGGTPLFWKGERKG